MCHFEKVQRNVAEIYTSDLDEGAIPSPELQTCRLERKRVSSFTVMDGHGGIQAAEFVNRHLFSKHHQTIQFFGET